MVWWHHLQRNRGQRACGHLLRPLRHSHAPFVRSCWPHVTSGSFQRKEKDPHNNFSFLALPLRNPGSFKWQLFVQQQRSEPFAFCPCRSSFGKVNLSELSNDALFVDLCSLILAVPSKEAPFKILMMKRFLLAFCLPFSRDFSIISLDFQISCNEIHARVCGHFLKEKIIWEN